MKKVILFAVVFFSWFPDLVMATEKEIAKDLIFYADPTWPPFSYCEGELAQGHFVEMIQKISTEMAPYRIKVACAPWKRGLTEIEEGRGFGIFGVYRNGKRPFIDAYSEPLYLDQQVLVCSSKFLEKKNPKFPQDFKGAHIATLSGYSYGKRLDQAAAQKQIHLSEAREMTTLIRQVINGRLDCFVHEKVAAEYELSLFFKSFPEEKKPFFMSEVLNEEPMLVGFSGKHALRGEARDVFLNKFNELLKKYRSQFVGHK